MIEVTQFCKKWENILKKPNDLFVSMTIPNISQYLLDELNSKSQITSYRFNLDTYEKELLDYLIFKIKDRKNLEKKIYSKNLLTQIRRNLKFNRINKRHIELLSANQFNNNLIKRYHNLFNYSLAKNNEKLIFFFLPFLLRSLLNEYSSEYLKELPKKTFSESYFQRYEKIIGIIMTDFQVSISTDQILNHLIKIIEVNSKSLQLNYKEIFSVRKRWNENNDYLTRTLRDKFMKESKVINNLLINKNFDSLKNNIQPIITNFIIVTIQKLTEFLILECLIKLENTIGIGISNTNYNFNVLQTMLVKQIPISKSSFPYSYISRAYFWSFVNIVNTYLVNKLNKLLNNEIDIFFNKFIKYLKKNNKKIKSFYFDNNFESLIHCFDFKLFIINYNKEFIIRNLEIIKDELSKIGIESHIDTGVYLNYISQKISKYLQSEGFNLIPSSLNKNVTKELFDSLLRTFNKINQKWQIFYTISDLNCNNAVFSIGETLFYDSRVWEFGESHKFDIHTPLMNFGELKGKFRTYKIYSDSAGKIYFKRNSARAVMNIFAKDPFIAIKKGQAKIYKVIDSLVFASSAGNNFGSRPRIYGNSMALTKDYNGFIHGESIPYQEILEINADYKDVITSYDKFLTTNTNRFKIKLEKSLSWYNIGRWNTFSHERFTGFWIALEQLISSNPKKKKESLILNVPQLTINWKSSSLSYSIIQHINEIVRFINDDPILIKRLNDDVKLKCWQHNPSNIFLSNLNRLANLTKGNKAENSVNNLKLYMKQFNHNILISETETLQRIQKFIIAILNSLRNKIMHEGLSYSPQIDYMLIEIENILVSTVNTLFHLGHKKRLNDIIKEFNKPYNFPLTKLNGFNPKIIYNIVF
jgi:hypothetical protein